MDEFKYGQKEMCGWENNMGFLEKLYEREWNGK